MIEIKVFIGTTRVSPTGSITINFRLLSALAQSRMVTRLIPIKADMGIMVNIFQLLPSALLALVTIMAEVQIL